jgi:hypothetical protein
MTVPSNRNFAPLSRARLDNEWYQRKTGDLLHVTTDFPRERAFSI